MPNPGNTINRGTLIIGISLVILLIGLGYFRSQGQPPEFAEGTTIETETPDSEPTPTEEELTNQPPDQEKLSARTQQSEQQVGTLSRNGTLLVSDTPAKGNLMLKTPTSTFYIQTSQDYSALIGKAVTVTGLGTIEHLNMLNITEKK